MYLAYKNCSWSQCCVWFGVRTCYTSTHASAINLSHYDCTLPMSVRPEYVRYLKTGQVRYVQRGIPPA